MFNKFFNNTEKAKFTAQASFWETSKDACSWVEKKAHEGAVFSAKKEHKARRCLRFLNKLQEEGVTKLIGAAESNFSRMENAAVKREEETQAPKEDVLKEEYVSEEDTLKEDIPDENLVLNLSYQHTSI